MQTTDLDKPASPEEVPRILREAAQRYRQSASELQAAWQDDSAGLAWAKLADDLDKCAARAERTVARYFK